MEENKKREVPEKMSYEQLENIAHQMSEQSRNLYSQNQQLAQKLKETELSNFFKKLEWLWLVINSDTTYLSEQFKIKCGQEFMESLTPPEESKESEESEESDKSKE